MTIGEWVEIGMEAIRKVQEDGYNPDEDFEPIERAAFDDVMREINGDY